MAKYLIHACNQRMWYVNEYLIPSMIKQGINPIDISVWQDKTCKGNLLACIDAFSSVAHKNGGTWHLQDDTIISSNFKELTERYDRGIKCGFCGTHDDKTKTGFQFAKDMWYSFPCIRVPNVLADKFVQWFYLNANNFGSYVEAKKYDDSIFREFMKAKYPSLMVTNITPNLVNHIDYLIGGSIINDKNRREPIVSQYWEESELIEELKRGLKR